MLWSTIKCTTNDCEIAKSPASCRGFLLQDGLREVLLDERIEYNDGRLFSYPIPEGCIYFEDGGIENFEYFLTDHLGNTRVVFSDRDDDGHISRFFEDLEIRAVKHYYPYGMEMSGEWQQHDSELLSYDYGYNGIELLENRQLNLARYRILDPGLGRWYQVDPKAEYLYGLTPYNSMGNSPVIHVDPDGDFAFAPFLVAMAVGAAIGAGTSAAIYSVNALISGSWNWRDFRISVAMGAVGGAIGGGISGAFAGTAFANSLGFGILNNVASNTATSLIFDQSVTWGTLIGGVAGGFVAGQIPGFTGVKGGWFKNAAAEIGYNAGNGAITGAVSGGVAAAVDQRDIGQGILSGAKYGAIGGATQAGLNIVTMGAAYVPERDYGFFEEKHKPVYRTGTFITRFFAGEGSGITLGRNLVTHQYKNKSSYANHHLRAHETAHFLQQRIHGFGKFYGRTAKEYLIDPGFMNVYGTQGTFEYQADQYATNFLRLWP